MEQWPGAIVSSIGAFMTHDHAVLAIVSRRAPTTYADVIERLRALDGALPPTDGLRWFNRLYRIMTEAVSARAASSSSVFKDPAYLQHLDCKFAELYFGALRTFLTTPAATPRAWEPLFLVRHRADLAPLQFALAGVNAHINRDLCVALTAAFRDHGGDTSPAGPRHADYQVIDAILADVHAEVKLWLITGALAEVDRAFGRHDDVAQTWSLARAREGAWINGQVRWHLRTSSFLEAAHLQSLDRMVGLTGRGLLQPLPGAPLG
jgi:hypothetical protein